MKKIKSIAIVVIIITLFQLFIPMYTYCALDEDVLLTSSGVTIKKTSKISDITSQYGLSPKVKTPSAFGGETCTWYKGDYESVIYAETNSEGVIMTCGALSNDFKSILYSAGDTLKSSNITRLQGVGVGISTAKGVVVYQKDLISNEVLNKYANEYISRKDEYKKYICQHSVHALNYLLRKNGLSVRVEYNEELFDKATKVMETMSMEDYATKNMKTSSYKASQRIYSYQIWDSLPNPFKPADSATAMDPTEELKYAYLTYNLKKDSSQMLGYGGGMTTFFMANNLFDKKNEIELTSEEKNKYQNACKLYLDSVSEFNQGGTDYFEIQPVNTTVPLVAGKIKLNKLKGSTGYLNAIRAAAGINTVKLNEDVADAAQHKATLTTYLLYKGRISDDPHVPKKPDEVDQSFYDRGQQHMTENLFTGNVISSITNALSDTAGDPITTGHRYNLLNPYHTDFGIGYASYNNGRYSAEQSAHKFITKQTSETKIVAWPSIGITPVEAFTNGSNWTFKIYGSKYSITSETTVKVVRLNDNKQWEFLNEVNSGKNVFVRNSKMVTFNNADLLSDKNTVYQITIKNLKNNTENKNEDYTYRAVFKGLTDTEIVYPTKVSLDKTSIRGTVGVTQNLKLGFEPFNDVTEIATTWTTDNPNVATVNQAGKVTITGVGTATITATTLNGKTATCKVEGVKQLAGIKFEQDVYYVRKGATQHLNVIETSNIPIDEKSIKWKLSDSSKAKVEDGEFSILTAEPLEEITVTATLENVSATCKVIVLSKYDTFPEFRVQQEDGGVAKRIGKGETQTVKVTQTNSNTNITSFEFDIPYNSTNLSVESIRSEISGLVAKVNTSGNIHVKYDYNGKIEQLNKDLLHITFKAITDKQTDNTIAIKNGTYFVYGKTESKTPISQYVTSVDTYSKPTFVNTEIQYNDTYKQLLKARTTDNKEIVVDWVSNKTDVIETQKGGYVIPKSGGFARLKASNSTYGDVEVWVYVCLPIVLSDGSIGYPGDLDGDGTISPVDASYILDIYKNGVETPEQLKMADINGDGVVDVFDSSYINDIYKYSIFTVVKQEETNPSPSPTPKPTPSVDPTPNPSPSPSPDLKYKLGDVNEDGKITAEDAQLVLAYYVGKQKNLTDSQKKAADVTKDGKITAEDASKILQYYVGKIKQF